MPRRSIASRTASFKELDQALQVSTCPSGVFDSPFPTMAVRASLMKLIITLGPALMPAPFAITLSDIRYKSSLSTLIPTVDGSHLAHLLF